MTSTSSEKLTGFFPPSKTVARNTKLTNPVVLVKVSDGYSADDNQEPAADVSETATIKYTTEENHDHLKVATPNAKTLLATAPDRTTCKKARKPRATKKQPPGAIEAGIEGSAPNVLESNGPPRKKARKSRASKEKPSLDAPEMKSNEKTKKPRAGKKRFGESPWPELKNPTPEECAEVNRRLTATHGPSTRPKKLVVNNSASGCGEVPCVMDALLRTILSLNTTTYNSGRAFRGLIERFGIIQPDDEEAASFEPSSNRKLKRNYTAGAVGSVNWNAVRLAPVKELEESIKFGGLQVKKARTIKDILDRVWNEGKLRRKQQRHEEALNRISARAESLKRKACDPDSDSELSDVFGDDDDDGELTLDHLHKLDNVALLENLTSFPGIGYKAASCVMLFSLGRDIFPVDTHVHRMTKFLGWVPETANENTGFFHLDMRIPDEFKYSLHNLFIRHGRSCKRCKGGPESKAKNINKPKPKPKIKEGDLDDEGYPIKVKKTKKVWIGNGLMKEIVVEIDTDYEGGQEDDSCCLEDLVKRVRKPRRTAPGSKKAKEEVLDDEEGGEDAKYEAMDGTHTE